MAEPADRIGSGESRFRLLAILCEHLLAKYRESTACTGIAPDARSLLLGYHWPGNIRQLESEIERASVLVGAGNQIEGRHLSSKVRRSESEVPPLPGTAAVDDQLPLREARAAFEAEFIRRALARCDRNVSRTAHRLGLSRVTLQKKMKDYGLRHG